MANFDWKGAIGKVAPWVATALGGPAAGLAVDAIVKATGCTPTKEAVMKMVQEGLNGEQFVQLKLAEEAFQLQMQQMGYANIERLEELEFKDREGARNREIQLRDRTPTILAYAVTTGFFGILAFMLRFDIPGTSRDVLNIMLGALGTAWISIIGYYYGSSHSSTQKNSIIAKQVDDLVNIRKDKE